MTKASPYSSLTVQNRKQNLSGLPLLPVPPVLALTTLPTKSSIWNKNLSWYILENWSRVRCHEKGHFNTSRPDPGRKKKYNLNFYFHTSLWCLKRFYEGLKDVYKTFWRTTKECENKKIKLIFILIQLSEIPRVGRIHNRILLKP